MQRRHVRSRVQEAVNVHNVLALDLLAAQHDARRSAGAATSGAAEIGRLQTFRAAFRGKVLQHVRRARLEQLDSVEFEIRLEHGLHIMQRHCAGWRGRTKRRGRIGRVAVERGGGGGRRRTNRSVEAERREVG